MEQMYKLLLLTNYFTFEYNQNFLACTNLAHLGMPEQARLARPRSGLDFQIHKSRGYPVNILEALLLSICLAWQKSVPASLVCICVTGLHDRFFYDMPETSVRDTH